MGTPCCEEPKFFVYGFWHINEDGSISYEGELYTEDKFKNLLNKFC